MQIQVSAVFHIHIHIQVSDVTTRCADKFACQEVGKMEDAPTRIGSATVPRAATKVPRAAPGSDVFNLTLTCNGQAKILFRKRGCSASELQEG